MSEYTKHCSTSLLLPEPEGAAGDVASQANSKMSIQVIHVALSPLAGSPVRIVNGLNQHTDVRARLVVFDPAVYGERRYPGDIEWNKNDNDLESLLKDADIVHFHHYVDLETNPFNLNFRHVCRRARFIRQFHTHPLTIANGELHRARAIVMSEIPQLVIGQYHERFYPKARVVPNIVPLGEALYKPLTRGVVEPVIFFAPTVDYPATVADSVRTRWDTKGRRETEALLRRVVKMCGKGRVVVRSNIPHEQCLREKQTSDIAMDEMITGSFHLSGLEALAQGLPTFGYLDGRCLETLAELTGTHTHPWLNFRLEEAEGALAEMIRDDKLRQEIGVFARKWMEKYYNDRELVIHYVRAYEDLLERPEVFQRLRFDASSRLQMFLAQVRDELVWEKRKDVISTMSPCAGATTRKSYRLVISGKIKEITDLIKDRVHSYLRKCRLIREDDVQKLGRSKEPQEFVAGDETARWLYANRQERMDAMVDIFENSRREFHLARYRFAAERVRGKRVLDCASGTGYGVQVLKESGRAEIVIGVDSDIGAAAYGRKTYCIGGTAFLCASGDRMPVRNGSIDAIISFETIEHVGDDVALVSEFYRVLRRGGLLIISTPNQWPVAVSPFHLREYDRRSFVKVLEPYFDCIEFYNQNSGTDSPYNHGQRAGIVETAVDNEALAECYIAVCRRKL